MDLDKHIAEAGGIMFANGYDAVRDRVIITTKSMVMEHSKNSYRAICSFTPYLGETLVVMRKDSESGE